MRFVINKRRLPGRAGFTLVEMLVSLALILFIMVILSEAFVTGLHTFRQLKAMGDMQERLRGVANIMRRDLRAPHFEGNKRLSELTVSGKPMPRLEGLRAAGIYNIGVPADVQELLALDAQLRPYRMAAPSLGFFSIEEWPNRLVPPAATMFNEGTDALGRPSFRDISDVLHFTTRLDGNDGEKFFYGQVRPANVPLGIPPSPLDGIGLAGSRYDSNAGMYSSQWAEVLYFLGPDDSASKPGVGSPGGPVQTFNLYRRRLLLTPDQFSDGSVPAADTFYQGSAPGVAYTQFFQQNDASAAMVQTINGPHFHFNSPGNVQHRARRYQAQPVVFPRSPKTIFNTTNLDGGDLLLTNVVSFDVKVWDPFAYRIPQDLANPNPALGAGSGRGAFVDISDVQAINGVNLKPTAWTDPNDGMTAVYSSSQTNAGADTFFDTGTNRQEDTPGTGTTLVPRAPTHLYPFNTIQITIRVFDNKSRQTRQFTFIQDM